MTIELYDATLRDGMQGEGMTLTAEEKVRVAHRLDELGLDLDRGRLPRLQPQGARALRLLAGEPSPTRRSSPSG